MAAIGPLTAISKLLRGQVILAEMIAAMHGVKALTGIQKVFFALGKGSLFIGKIFAGFGKIFGVFGKFLGPLLGTVGKFLGPIGWVIMAFQGIAGFISGWKKAEGGFFSKLFGGIMGALRGIIPGFDYIVKALKWFWGWAGKIYIFMFKWFTPIGLLIQGFKFIKKLFPETFSAISGLFGKIWGFYKKIYGYLWEGLKFLFKWGTPIGWVIQSVKFLSGLLGGMWGDAWGKVKNFFGGIFNFIKDIRSKFVGMITNLVGGIDHFIAGILNKVSSAVSRLFGWIKKGWIS